MLTVIRRACDRRTFGHTPRVWSADKEALRSPLRSDGGDLLVHSGDANARTRPGVDCALPVAESWLRADLRRPP